MTYLASLLLGAAVAGELFCDTTLAEREAYAQYVTSNLTAQGWTVEKGNFKFLVNNTHFGANPGNPYGVYEKRKLMVLDLPVFKLDEREVILNLACTPPEAAYFSWRSYVFSQGFSLLFASLGDSLNNLVVNTTTGTYSSTTAVLTSADATSIDAVSAQLGRAGFPLNAVNVDRIPSSLINMKEDRFMMLHRASVFQNQSQKAEYYQTTYPVYFLTPPSSTAFDPLPVVPLRKQGDGHREQDISGLIEGLQLLNTSLIGSMKDTGKLVRALTMQELFLDGFTCIKENINCLGDNHDTHYLTAKEFHPLGENDVWVVYGTNNVNTGKCVYNNLGLYYGSAASFKSTTTSVNHHAWEGSASAFAPSLPESVAKNLFAFLVSRDCSKFSTAPFARFCVELPVKDVSLSEDVTLAYRTYLEPATKTAPALSEIVFPSVLYFKGP